jgi:hypothetical protein
MQGFAGMTGGYRTRVCVALIQEVFFVDEKQSFVFLAANGLRDVQLC